MAQLLAVDGAPINVRAIMAIDRTGVLGYDDKLIFNNPADLMFFRSKTFGRVCVMGRKTFESIGRILPDRQTVIITHQVSKVKKQVEEMKLPKNTPAPIVSSEPMNAIVAACNSYNVHDVYICGGASIYKIYYPVIRTFVVTNYHIDVRQDPEHRFLPKDYDPKKLAVADMRFKAMLSSSLDAGEWEGVRYRIMAYVHNSTGKGRNIKYVADENQDSNFYDGGSILGKTKFGADDDSY